jgi:hypothetical protein
VLLHHFGNLTPRDDNTPAKWKAYVDVSDDEARTRRLIRIIRAEHRGKALVAVSTVLVLVVAGVIAKYIGIW